MTAITCPRCLGLKAVPAYPTTRNWMQDEILVTDLTPAGAALGRMEKCPDCKGRGAVNKEEK